MLEGIEVGEQQGYLCKYKQTRVQESIRGISVFCFKEPNPKIN